MRKTIASLEEASTKWQAKALEYEKILNRISCFFEKKLDKWGNAENVPYQELPARVESLKTLLSTYEARESQKDQEIQRLFELVKILVKDPRLEREIIRDEVMHHIAVPQDIADRIYNAPRKNGF